MGSALMTRDSIWLGVGLFVLAMMVTFSADPSGWNSGGSSLSLGGSPAFARRDQWVPEFKSSKSPKVSKNRNDDDDDDATVKRRTRVNKANEVDKDDEDDNDSNELPEWADDAL
jgi:hypothetical protein